MADQTLTCQDCGASFIFSTSEQQFFADKGYTSPPSRCLDCRRARRERGGGQQSGGRTADRVMTDITCSSCGKPAQVPFVPRGDRPVYCAECHAQQSGGSRGGSGRFSNRRY